MKPWELQPDPGARDGAIHEEFGLSYANYLVVPRSLLQSMPLAWQEHFVACLRVLYQAFPDVEWPAYNVQALKRETQVIADEYPCESCSSVGRLHNGEECEECDGLGRVDSGDYRYETPEEVGTRTDPIPHYDRGRTRILRCESLPVESAS